MAVDAPLAVRVATAARRAAPWRRGDLVLPRRPRDTIVLLVHSGTGNRTQMRGWADFYAEHGYRHSPSSTSLPDRARPRPCIGSRRPT
jgi:hypothetical protein